MKALLTAIFFLATAAGAAAFDFDKTPGRLPKIVVPLDYTIAFTPNMAAKAFVGTERVTLWVRKPTNRLVFNTLNQTLSNVRVDGIAAQSVLTQNDKQLSTVMLARPLRAGHHVMTLSFTGKIESGPRGLYAQPYRTAAGSGTMLSSQLESTDARRFFPCWDEPAFRARFTLTATIPAAWSAIGNMPIAHRVVHGSLADITFRATPKMSTYLLEFTAGNLGHISARNDGYTHTIWTVRGEEKNGSDALQASQDILNDYNAYFGFRFPIPKLDSIAIPGGFPGAMENWGAITYNDLLLLTGPTTTITARQIAWDVQAHEMSHQWTGDLVTMDWWSNIWLNESFATWMEIKETALRHPDWAWWEASDGELQGAFDADARPTQTAIITPVENELEAEASFNPAIVYTKGGQVVEDARGVFGRGNVPRGYAPLHPCQRVLKHRRQRFVACTERIEAGKTLRPWLRHGSRSPVIPSSPKARNATPSEIERSRCAKSAFSDKEPIPNTNAGRFRYRSRVEMATFRKSC